MLQALIVEPLSLLVNKCQNQNIIGGFCTDQIVFRVRDTLTLKKKREKISFSMH